MPCIFALLAVAFPRVAIVLLYVFTSFFTGVYHGIVIPLLGFLFLPLTLLVYTYLVNIHAPIAAPQLVFFFIAVLIDLGSLGGGAWSRGRAA